MPSSWYYKFNAFVEAVAEKKHDFENDQFMIALIAAANPPDANDAVLTDLTEIADYSHCSTRVITKTSSGQTGGGTLSRAIIREQRADVRGRIRDAGIATHSGADSRRQPCRRHRGRSQPGDSDGNPCRRQPIDSGGMVVRAGAAR